MSFNVVGCYRENDEGTSESVCVCGFVWSCSILFCAVTVSLITTKRKHYMSINNAWTSKTQSSWLLMAHPSCLSLALVLSLSLSRCFSCAVFHAPCDSVDNTIVCWNLESPGETLLVLALQSFQKVFFTRRRPSLNVSTVIKYRK